MRRESEFSSNRRLSSNFIKFRIRRFPKKNRSRGTGEPLPASSPVFAENCREPVNLFEKGGCCRYNTKFEITFKLKGCLEDGI